MIMYIMSAYYIEFLCIVLCLELNEFCTVARAGTVLACGCGSSAVVVL